MKETQESPYDKEGGGEKRTFFSERPISDQDQDDQDTHGEIKKVTRFKSVAGMGLSRRRNAR